MSDAHIYLLFGLIYLALGIGISSDLKRARRMFKDFADQPALSCLLATAAVVIGYLLIVHRPTCGNGWAVLLTVVGYLALVKGFLVLALPRLIARTMDWFTKRLETMRLVAVLVLAFGLAMTAIGLALM